MVRLEGLIKGGAIGTHEACFMEHLRALKDPLLDQMVDRCACDTSSSRRLLPFLQAPAWQLDTDGCPQLRLPPCLVMLTTLSCVRVIRQPLLCGAGARRLRASVRTCLL